MVYSKTLVFHLIVPLLLISSQAESNCATGNVFVVETHECLPIASAQNNNWLCSWDQQCVCECHDTKGSQRSTLLDNDICYIRAEIGDVCETDEHCQISFGRYCARSNKFTNVGTCSCANNHLYHKDLKECRLKETSTSNVKPTPDASSSTSTERYVTTTPAPKHNHEIIIWTTLLSSLLIIFLAAFGWYYYRKLRRERRKKSSLETMLPSQRSLDLIPQNGMNVDSSVRAPLISPLTFKLSENPGSSSREVMQYEIPENQFEIDFEAILGKGNFGIVYRGSVRGKEVAVKTLLPDILDPKSIRNMEAEMRVMSELGTHPNIVRLVGVNTAHVDQGKVYIFTEICPLGGLQAYMRKHKAAFIDNDMENVFPSDTTVLTPCDLYKWSYQVCSGMMYLADRKIIHGDLATRNILLLNKDHVKIADFGLALKMYNYSGYVRRLEQEQLPWKWMAIETLKYEKFSLESDIWSFGILLWEIFTLGEIPYPGRRNCTNKFIQEVEEGVRAEQPAHANKEVYEIMMKCWRLEPETRPTFGQVRTILHTFLDQEYLELDALQEDVLEDEQGYLMPTSLG